MYIQFVLNLFFDVWLLFAIVHNMYINYNFFFCILHPFFCLICFDEFNLLCRYNDKNETKDKNYKNDKNNKNNKNDKKDKKDKKDKNVKNFKKYKSHKNYKK